ncbi:hypothetical protein C8J37_11610 [Rhizobium sp. PP-WC-1G-195]|nr:hypothetical protein C8J37_11610 [Rhizobium sp. PP-WC-1G-195]
MPGAPKRTVRLRPHIRQRAAEGKRPLSAPSRRSVANLLGLCGALSDALFIVEKWPSSSSKTVKFTTRNTQRRLSAQPLTVVFLDRRCRTTAASPLSSARTRRLPISPALPIAPAALLKPPVPPTPAKPTLLTGSIFSRGAGDKPHSPAPASTDRGPLCNRLCLKQSSWRAVTRGQGKLNADNQAPTGASSQGPAYCHRDGRHLQQPYQAPV